MPVQVDAVDVDLVVPEVDRRLDGLDSRGQPGGLRPGVVVGLEPIGWGEHAAEGGNRLRHVQAAPAAVGVALQWALLAPVGRADVRRRPLEDVDHLVRLERRVQREENCGGRSDLWRCERRPRGVAELVGAAVRVALVRTRGAHCGERARQRRKDVLAGRRHVVVDAVAVGEGGDVSRRRQRADAEHVRECGRIAGVRPGALRRLVGVPDGGDEHCPVPHGVVNRVRLDLGERIQPRVERVAQAADRQVDHAGADVDRPPDGLRFVSHVDRLVGARDLRDHELGGKCHPCNALVVVDRRCDLSGHERPVALLVGERAAADPAARLPDVLPRELRMAAVEAGVYDRDADGVDDGQLRAERVERVILPEVVLVRHEWIRRREARADREGVRRRRQHERERHGYGCPHWFETCRTGVVPATNPCPEPTRAR